MSADNPQAILNDESVYTSNFRDTVHCGPTKRSAPPQDALTTTFEAWEPSPVGVGAASDLSIRSTVQEAILHEGAMRQVDSKAAPVMALSAESSQLSGTPSMITNKTSAYASIRLGGSVCGQTRVLTQSATRLLHTMPSSIVLPGAQVFNREYHPYCAEDSVDMEPSSQANVFNADGVDRWRRVQLVPLSSGFFPVGSPVPVTPVGMTPPTITPLSPRATEGDQAEREDSPSRPPSTAFSSVTDTSRLLNLSCMSNSMSFRPPIQSPILGTLPKGPPLALDSSFHSTTPRSFTAIPGLMHPKARSIHTHTEPITTVPTEGSSLVCMPLDRMRASIPNNMPHTRTTVSGASRRGSTPAVLTDPHDSTAIMSRAKVPVPDTGAFKPWIPPNFDRDETAPPPQDSWCAFNRERRNDQRTSFDRARHELSGAAGSLPFSVIDESGNSFRRGQDVEATIAMAPTKDVHISFPECLSVQSQENEEPMPISPISATPTLTPNDEQRSRCQPSLREWASLRLNDRSEETEQKKCAELMNAPPQAGLQRRL